ncbi:serine hydrolase domain-containing protein [Novosphingobium ginsenosidimutans]|uniref:Beta-lactamase family protein n=1 Tax=Novosphingobium ginsenosidimutans TaxID=1176536 RepID=A0A5B8S7F8_9SPHN|nr:serine hydrolase domain-containing protein [Novosphingobium ginsenosidimutans]QEA17343.1 beta-lactamase family protein [Novosphingobium ginsenosidimutans]
MSGSTEITIGGTCTDRFAAVRAAFERNFALNNEIGASFAVTLNGELVVDLHGGWADAARTRPWGPDTLVNVWSTTKGVQATCFAMAADRGLFSYDQPVAAFWPEFAAAGKDRVTVGQLLSHQAGICGFTAAATEADLLSGNTAAQRLAQQVPIWEPASASGYHALSIGILGTELFRRIEGRSIRQFVAEEIAGPLGLDFAIGLDSSQNSRCAELVPPPALPVDPTTFNAAQLAAMGNPPLRADIAMTKTWRDADLPSANGHGTARALASIYAALIAPEGGLVSPQGLAAATSRQIRHADLVLGMECDWAAGFLLNSSGLFGPIATAFGHSGWGGSFACADPENRLTIAYTMNRMDANLRDDARANALVAAVYSAI